MLLVYFDSNVFMHALEARENDPARPFAEALMHLVRDERIECVTNELTLAEVLAPTKQRGRIDPKMKRIYLELLVWGGHVRLEPLIRDDMYLSAEIRLFQKARVYLPDLLHIATAARVGATHFVTNDKAIRVPEPMTRLRLTAADIDPFLEARA